MNKMHFKNVQGVRDIFLEREMEESYMQYAMSTIVSRALPDSYDGCKPVQRRIFHSMNENKCYVENPYRKSARIIGDITGKYHPHGEQAVYDAMARMAQPFTMRIPLIDGQGNFGSTDGDPPAAMRYTEARLTKLAYEGLLKDIDKDSVDFTDNYDGSQREPLSLPAAFPVLLVNGSAGVAVGMATNIPPHNLGEIIDACLALIDNRAMTSMELANFVNGPDFPTGGIIMGLSGIRSAYETGRGVILLRAKTHFEDMSHGKSSIIITEMPYQVNKARMLEQIAELVNEKRLEGISDLRDESDRSGVRVVIELKRDVNRDIVLSKLFAITNMQISFGINMVALKDNRPILMSLRNALDIFIVKRLETLSRRITCVLHKAQAKCHALVGMCVAVSNIEEVIKIIRSSSDASSAVDSLTSKNWEIKIKGPLEGLLISDANLSNGKYKLTIAQAKAILDMRLQRLVNLEYDKLLDEITNLMVEIENCRTLLGDDKKLNELMKSELSYIREKFSDPRRTAIEQGEINADIEDLIDREDVLVTLTAGGYVKRVLLSTYKLQSRGGKGRSGHVLKGGDALTNLFFACTHDFMLFFSDHGKVYKSKVYNLPPGEANSKGRAIVNILPLAEGERIVDAMVFPGDNEIDGSIIFSTKNGYIRRNDVSAFARVPSGGKIAIKLEDRDALVGVALCSSIDHVMLATASGRCIRFEVSGVRSMASRSSSGVRGVNLKRDDYVVSMSVLNCEEVFDQEKRNILLKVALDDRENIRKSDSISNELMNNLSKVAQEIPIETIIKMIKSEQFVFVVTENGFGKMSSIYEYRNTNRGGVGIMNIITSKRNGRVVASFPVDRSDEVVLMTDTGNIIRIAMSEVRVTGRNAQGVTLFRTNGAKVVSVSKIANDESEVEKEDNVTKVDNKLDDV